MQTVQASWRFRENVRLTRVKESRMVWVSHYSRGLWSESSYLSSMFFLPSKVHKVDGKRRKLLHDNKNLTLRHIYNTRCVSNVNSAAFLQTAFWWDDADIREAPGNFQAPLRGKDKNRIFVRKKRRQSWRAYKTSSPRNVKKCATVKVHKNCWYAYHNNFAAHLNSLVLHHTLLTWSYLKSLENNFKFVCLFKGPITSLILYYKIKSGDDSSFQSWILDPTFRSGLVVEL